MLQIYVTCGVWRCISQNEWRFIVDEEKRGRLLTFEANSTLEELKMMVLEDYEIQQNMVDVKFSYLPFDLSVDSPSVVMMNDRQVKNFVAYWRMKNNIRLCVTFKATVNDRSNIDLNKESSDSSEGGVDVLLREKLPKFVSKAKPNDSNFITSKDAEVGARSMMVDSMVKKGQYFKSKEALQASLEIFAMKYNFDYRVTKSGRRFWCIRCIDNVCKWRVRAECFEGSTCWKINKYVGSHTCAPSRKTKFGKTPSARTIGNLIKHNYEGVKEGPKPNDIINIMRTENGCELTYSQAWESREYAINEVRGIPEKSFAKIPNYLHMLKEANPGTHTNYDIDCDGRFKYLFISFGQSIRGFYKKIRKVIVVDGTFLKNKYKGVLLVATAVDGNSNLYPIAFGIADSENDASWEWFLMQLKVVIADDKDLAFVSDRHISIGKMIGKIYPLAKHGICIHHLIGNVVKNYKGRGVAGRLAKASKAYRVAEFDKHFAEICNISPAIGGYLQEADVKKWARCHFLGYRYDINTNNPAESINSALRSPREYPIIPLLDSIRDMLTRWFYERRAQSEQQNDPLTIDVEQKISRRIEKGEKFKAYPISQFILQIKGKGVDFIVDLEKRTCSCGKFDTGKLPCRHAIKACFSIGKSLYPYADDVFTTAAWRSLYEENINPIGVPEDEWCVPETVGDVKIVPPETRRGAGRRRKRRYESVEDKIRSSQGAKRRKCGRCGKEGHNRSTCENTI